MSYLPRDCKHETSETMVARCSVRNHVHDDNALRSLVHVNHRRIQVTCTVYGHGSQVNAGYAVNVGRAIADAPIV